MPYWAYGQYVIKKDELYDNSLEMCGTCMVGFSVVFSLKVIFDFCFPLYS